MKRLVLGVMAAGSILSGCGANSVDDIRAGIPSKEAVALKVPQKANAVLGETAPWYVATYATTGIVNLGVVAVLDLMAHVVASTPTKVDGDVYTWGPSEPTNPLEPNVYKVTVTDKNNGSYDYVVEGRKKTDADTAFVVLLSGTHTPAKLVTGKNDPKHGKGTFLLDWNARQKIAVPGKEVGSFDVTYAHVTDDTTVDVNFHQVKNEQGQLVDATYHYAQVAGGDGSFKFGTESDAKHDGTPEKFAIHSRWDKTGAGRADLRISGSGLAAGVTGSECWDTNFAETFYKDSANFLPATGVESACTIQGAVYYDAN